MCVSLQDEQLYRNLHEEINHLALKLEKQEKTDGKNISSRRKHINKMYTLTYELCIMRRIITTKRQKKKKKLQTLTTQSGLWCFRWLKVQAHLKNYHENLQLALEVSSFYQQADNTMFAIDNMVRYTDPKAVLILHLMSLWYGTDIEALKWSLLVM